MLEVEVAIEKLKRCTSKSPDASQIPAEMIEAGGRTVCSEIDKLIDSVWNEEEIPWQWKELVIVPIYMKGDKADCNNWGMSLLSTRFKVYPTFFCQDELHM